TKKNIVIQSKREIATKKSHKQEILIFSQATLSNGYMFGLMVAWHASGLLGLTQNYYQCIINCIWISFCYLNPLLLLILNK
ncbi:hypothetical protein NECAME_13606, partial [Necator americanus]